MARRLTQNCALEVANGARLWRQQPAGDKTRIPKDRLPKGGWVINPFFLAGVLTMGAFGGPSPHQVSLSITKAAGAWGLSVEKWVLISASSAGGSQE